ncbi:hypothetical protein F4804DRAFT_333109 [Jackrogersella minutella]|nr:hypothetical protein F4804DRAFT_333109 [Jackrogersella minutella]
MGGGCGTRDCVALGKRAEFLCSAVRRTVDRTATAQMSCRLWFLSASDWHRSEVGRRIVFLFFFLPIPPKKTVCASTTVANWGKAKADRRLVRWRGNLVRWRGNLVRETATGMARRRGLAQKNAHQATKSGSEKRFRWRSEDVPCGEERCATASRGLGTSSYGEHSMRWHLRAMQSFEPETFERCWLFKLLSARSLSAAV